MAVDVYFCFVVERKSGIALPENLARMEIE